MRLEQWTARLRETQSVFVADFRHEERGQGRLELSEEASEAMEELADWGVRPWSPWPEVGLPVLLVRGSLPTPSALAIVGARAADAYGRACARQIAVDAHHLGYSVVSGGAEGCDLAAHRGAMDAGGITTVVLGHGHNFVYPRAHAELFDEIVARGGSLVSPYWPTAPPKPYRFRLRNEVIARLSKAVVVVRARKRSGSLSTARAAQSLGRPVLALPSNVGEGLGEGTNALLAEGAQILLGPGDLARALGEAAPNTEAWPLEHQGAPAPWSVNREVQSVPLSGEETQVLGFFQKGEFLDLGTLAMRSGMAVSQLVSVLMGLEVGGRIEKTPAGTYGVCASQRS